jgi:hypothetical protein
MNGCSSPREAFAYSAGYIDGEGCIGYWRGRPELKLETCNPYPLKFISQHFGGKVLAQKRKTQANRTVYRLHYTNSNAVKILNHTVEFMHEKKKQANLCLTMHEMSTHLTADKKKSH